MVAKTPGVASPCTKRQSISCGRLAEVAARAVATASRNADATITRLRPTRSARRPTAGAASATATVDAVTVRLTAKWVAEKTRISSGSSGCVA